VTSLEVEVRPGAYYDSVVLMQLQRSLVELAGVEDAGVVMGTAANKELLTQNDLLPPDAAGAKPDDLVIVIKARDAAAGEAALARVDDLLARRRPTVVQEYRPQSLEAAVQMLPEARWVLISVPGRYAAGVAREALRLKKNVFLYSDNVSVEDEVALKSRAAEHGLLVMGPDCGTAIVNGIGLGFANAVRRGPIGIVAASGTGLQAVSVGIHQLGSGVSHALGTGGRDFSEPVGAATARQALELLGDDSETQVVVLISKPPAPEVAENLLWAARALGKPTVVNFIGYSPPPHEAEVLDFTSTFDETARRAVELAGMASAADGSALDLNLDHFAPGQRNLRGLFSGGTLAYEAQLILRDFGHVVRSNVPLEGKYRLADPLVSEGHTIIDLGEDVFTVGRLHPMLDNELRIGRLYKEAADPAVAVVLLDVVLGYGAHPDPASELGPAISEVRHRAERDGRYIEIVAMVIGTDEDPQNLDEQVAQLRGAGAHVETSSEAAVRYAGRVLRELKGRREGAYADLAALNAPLAAINVGLETFAENLALQAASVVQVDWRPPAGGNERLMGILERMKQ
jgi:FdrA protein